jgi:hypothetical protein
MTEENIKKDIWSSKRPEWVENPTKDELQVTYRKPNTCVKKTTNAPIIHSIY